MVMICCQEKLCWQYKSLHILSRPIFVPVVVVLVCLNYIYCFLMLFNSKVNAISPLIGMECQCKDQKQSKTLKQQVKRFKYQITLVLKLCNNFRKNNSRAQLYEERSNNQTPPYNIIFSFAIFIYCKGSYVAKLVN